MEDLEQDFTVYDNSHHLSPQHLEDDDDDDDGTDVEDVQYGGGFLAFRGHPNSLAMQQRLLKVNEEWNSVYSEEISTRQRNQTVRFNPNHELIEFQDFFDELHKGEETGSNSPQRNESDDDDDEWCESTSSVSKAVKNTNNETIDMKTEIIRLVQELRAPLEVEAVDNVELKEFRVPESRAPLPIPILSNFKLNLKRKSNDDLSASVISAVFHMKSLTALQKLQHPDKIPLVRAQIQKRKLSPEILRDIFSAKFVKLMFEEKEDTNNATTINTLHTVQRSTLTESDSSSNSSTTIEGNTQSQTSSSNQFHIVEPEMSVKDSSEYTVPALMSVVGEASDKYKLRGCNGSINLRLSIVGDGDMSRKSSSSLTDVKSSPSFSRTSIRPTSSKFMSNSQSVKKKVEYASRSINDKNDVRRYPLIDADWLERRIKPQENSRNGTSQKKNILYPVRSGSVPSISPVSSNSQSELGNPIIASIKTKIVPNIRTHQNDIIFRSSANKKPTRNNSFKKS